MFDVERILQVGGIVAVALMIFAESGLLIGIILPGDSLLLAAGVFAGRGHLNIYWLIPVTILAAIIGYEVGYIFGQRIGPKLFKRNDGFLFRQEYLGKTEMFFKKYGLITVVMARFVANVRTLVSLIAGASNMNRRSYFVYNVAGAILWVTSLCLAGYWLGARVPNIDKFILPAVVLALLILYAFTLYHLMRTPARRRDFKAGIKADWNYFVRGGRKKA